MRKGDNQWTAATIAIDPDDGSIRWGFQYTPWDCWDYDAVSTPVLADVTLPGHGPVKALFHHDKNGFFYALDRTDGRFLYGDPIVPGINWAHGLDPETGRPDVNLDMVAESGGPEVGPIIPSLEGAIDWQPLAYNPNRQALYFMSNQWAMGYRFWEEDQFEPPTLGEWYLGADYQQYLTSENPGNFVGFDVVNRKVLWRVVSPAPFWAGAVATSSGLVFTGDMRGYFMAIDAERGEVLWQFQTGSGIIGSPITYELDGVQYVAVPSGGNRRRHDVLLHRAEGREPVGVRAGRRPPGARSRRERISSRYRAASRGWANRAPPWVAACCRGMDSRQRKAANRSPRPPLPRRRRRPKESAPTLFWETKKPWLPANASTAPVAWDATGAAAARGRTCSRAG